MKTEAYLSCVATPESEYRMSLAYLMTKHLYWATWKRRTLLISSVLQNDSLKAE